MELLALISYFIAGSFVALLSLESGFALTLLFSYKKHKDIFPVGFRYLWGIVGTFAVFYLINIEATYPGLLPRIAFIYDAPLLIIGVLMLVKNSFIAYAYHVKDEKKEEIFLKIYAAATIFVVFLVSGVLVSAATGTSVNLQTESINLLTMFSNPLNLILFVAIMAASIFSYYGKKLGKILGPLAMAAGIFIFGAISYPYILGRKINLAQTITQSPAVIFSVIIVAILGYGLLIGSFWLLVKIHGLPGVSENRKSGKNISIKRTSSERAKHFITNKPKDSHARKRKKRR